jgi:hypothetical protein
MSGRDECYVCVETEWRQNGMARKHSGAKKRYDVILNEMSYYKGNLAGALEQNKLTFFCSRA